MSPPPSTRPPARAHPHPVPNERRQGPGEAGRPPLVLTLAPRSPKDKRLFADCFDPEHAAGRAPGRTGSTPRVRAAHRANPAAHSRPTVNHQPEQSNCPPFDPYGTRHRR
ncbi:hypothetical protein GCM10010232_27060 [Streptomyces amakusaensis]